MRRAFDSAAAADDVVGLVDLPLAEPKVLKQVESRLLPGRFGDIQPLERRLADRPGAEGKTDLELPRQRFLDGVQFLLR